MTRHQRYNRSEKGRARSRRAAARNFARGTTWRQLNPELSNQTIAEWKLVKQLTGR